MVSVAHKCLPFCVRKQSLPATTKSNIRKVYKRYKEIICIHILSFFSVLFKSFGEL